MRETVSYSSYGIPNARPAGDTNSDGDCDASDVTALGSPPGTYDVRYDLNLDGSMNSTDQTIASTTYQGTTLGWGVLSSSDIDNDRGYAGYRWKSNVSKYEVRHRFFDPELGRWTRRDPLGYVDGMSVYEYVGGGPQSRLDPMGAYLLQCGEQHIYVTGDCGKMPQACQDLLCNAYASDEVQAAVQRVIDECNGTLPILSCKDCGGRDPHYVPTRDVIFICPGETCDLGEENMRGTLIHELTHAWQACRYGRRWYWRFWGNMDTRICSELQAYCAEPWLKPSCDQGDFRTACSLACTSLDHKYDVTECRNRCDAIARRCKDGEYQKPRSAPQLPGPRPTVYSGIGGQVGDCSCGGPCPEYCGECCS